MPPLSSRNEAAAVMLRLRWIAKPGPFWDPKRPFSRSAPNLGKGSRAVMSGLRSEAQRPVSAPPQPAGPSAKGGKRTSDNARTSGADKAIPPGIGSQSLLHPLDVPWDPALVEGGFGRAVEPEDGEVSSARHGGAPVALFAFGCLGSEVDIRAAVGVLRRLVL